MQVSFEISRSNRSSHVCLAPIGLSENLHTLDPGIPLRVMRNPYPITHSINVFEEKVLNDELNQFLDKVQDTVEPYPIKGCKAIIAPSVSLL